MPCISFLNKHLICSDLMVRPATLPLAVVKLGGCSAEAVLPQQDKHKDSPNINLCVKFKEYCHCFRSTICALEPVAVFLAVPLLCLIDIHTCDSHRINHVHLKDRDAETETHLDVQCSDFGVQRLGMLNACSGLHDPYCRAQFVTGECAESVHPLWVCQYSCVGHAIFHHWR